MYSYSNLIFNVNNSSDDYHLSYTGMSEVLKSWKTTNKLGTPLGLKSA